MNARGEVLHRRLPVRKGTEKMHKKKCEVWAAEWHEMELFKDPAPHLPTTAKFVFYHFRTMQAKKYSEHAMWKMDLHGVLALVR